MLKPILINTIIQFFNVVNLLILIRILFSWIRVGYGNPIYNFFHGVTEPILGPCRMLLDRLGLRTGMFDFSPIVAVLLLQLIQRLLLQLVYVVL